MRFFDMMKLFKYMGNLIYLNLSNSNLNNIFIHDLMITFSKLDHKLQSLDL